MNRLRDFNTNLAKIRRAFTQKYNLSLDAVNTMMLRQPMHAFVIPRLINDLHVFLRPLLDILRSESVKTGLWGLKPFALSILWRLTPPTMAISRMEKIAEDSLKSSLLTSWRIPFTQSVPLVTYPTPPEFLGTAFEEMSRISDKGTRVQKTAPSLRLRVVPHESVRAEFTREAFGPEALEVPSTQLETDTLAEPFDKLRTPTVWTPSLAYAQRYLVAREMFEAYNTRILLPISKVHEAYRSARVFPMTEVVEAVPPTIPEIMKRGYELGHVSPRRLDVEQAVWPIPEIGQVKAHGTTFLATWLPIIKVIAKGLESPGYSMAIQVAGKPTIEPLRLKTGIIQKPLEQTYIEASSSVGALPMTDVVEAVASHQPLAQEMLRTYGIRVLEPISRVYEAPSLVGRLPIMEAIDEVNFPQPDLPIPSKLTVEMVKAMGLVYPISKSISGLRPIIGGEAKTYEMEFSRTEPPPSKVLAEQTESYHLHEQEAWTQSILEASKVASIYIEKMSGMLFGEEMARRFAVIQPLVKEATETAKNVPRTSKFMSRTSWLTTPISPLIMELGFGISEAKQLYPAVGVMSKVSRALDVSRILPREANAYRAGTGEAIESIISLLHAPVERYTLERIPLEAPRAFPTVKLHEIVPLLSSVRAPTRTERPPRIERVKSIERPRSIEVKVEPPRDERDLRELRRKITRILREEAKRHGVY
jgi:hypothetical protein